MIQLKHVSKEYVSAIETVKALQEVNIEIPEQQIVSIIGPSGSGKTTLLQIMGLLEEPSAGEVWIDGTLANALSARERAEIRNQKMGFIFQQFQLLPALTAIENVMLPVLQYKRKKEYLEKAEHLLERVGILHRRNNTPAKLSGGEQQRVAIARALMNDPKYILADELTGNLDYETSIQIMEFLKELNEREGKSIIMVTHNLELTRYSSVIYRIKGGVISRYEESAESMLSYS
jgi:putative ABC transport system ATP-binding protein